MKEVLKRTASLLNWRISLMYLIRRPIRVKASMENIRARQENAAKSFRDLQIDYLHLDNLTCRIFVLSKRRLATLHRLYKE